MRLRRDRAMRWLIGDTTFGVDRDDGGRWQVITSQWTMSVWLERTGLGRQRFRTRTQAVRAFEAVFASDPPDEDCTMQRARLRRVGPGRYVSDCGGFVVSRRGRIWTVAPSRRPQAALWVASTLAAAAEGVAHLRD